MKRFNRGTQIDFSITFYDVEGAVAVPDTATLTIKYPISGGNYPMDGSELAEMHVAMTRNITDETWEASWDSRVSAPGIVFWATVSSDPALTVEQGRFRVTGNPAAIAATDRS